MLRRLKREQGMKRGFFALKCLQMMRAARGPMRGAAVFSLILFAVTSLYALPVRLRVEQQTNPLGIDEMRPTFSWQSDATERGWTQSAYRILVASEAELL